MSEPNDLYDAPQPDAPVPSPSAPTRAENISAVARGPKSGKVIAVTIGAVVLVAGLLVVAFTSKKGSSAPLPATISGASVGDAPPLREQATPGLAGSAQYNEMVDQVNQARAAEAARTGASVQPLADSVARTLVESRTPAEQERLNRANAEAAAAAAAAGRPVTESVRQYPAAGEAQGAQAYNNGQDPMILNAQKAIDALLMPRERGMQTFDVSAPVRVAQAGAAGATSGSAAGPATTAGGAPVVTTAAASHTLIAAGSLEAARMDSAINTDLQGDFIATLVTGPYAGAKLVGTSQRAGDLASMRFVAMSLTGKGVTVPVSAVALDAASLEAGTATDVDRKLFVKYGVKPLMAGLAAVGQAVLNTGTSVTVDGATVVSTQPTLDGKQTGAIIAGAAAQQLTQDAGALNTTPTVRVAPGTVVGVMFVADVIYTPPSSK